MSRPIEKRRSILRRPLLAGLAVAVTWSLMLPAQAQETLRIGYQSRRR